MEEESFMAQVDENLILIFGKKASSDEESAERQVHHAMRSDGIHFVDRSEKAIFFKLIF